MQFEMQYCVNYNLNFIREIYLNELKKFRKSARNWKSSLIKIRNSSNRLILFFWVLQYYLINLLIVKLGNLTKISL